MSENITQAQALEAFEAFAVVMRGFLGGEPAAEPKAQTVKVAAAVEPKADARYRTAAQKAKGADKAKAIWAAHYAAAGVKRFADLTPAQQAAAKAEVNAAWKAIKGTRKTAA